MGIQIGILKKDEIRCIKCGKLLGKVKIKVGIIEIKCSGQFQGKKCRTLNTFEFDRRSLL